MAIIGTVYCKPAVICPTMPHDCDANMKRKSYARPTKAGRTNKVSPKMYIGKPKEAKIASETRLGESLEL